MTDGSISFSCATPRHEHRTRALASACDAERIADLEAELGLLRVGFKPIFDDVFSNEVTKRVKAEARLVAWRPVVAAACALYEADWMEDALIPPCDEEGLLADAVRVLAREHWPEAKP